MYMQKISQIKLFIILSCFISLCIVLVHSKTFGTEIIDNRPWYQAAKEYLEADSILLRHAIDKNETFSEDYNSRSKAQADLLSAPNPSESDLGTFLQSKDVNEIRVALVAISIKQIYSEKLFNIILKRYNEIDNYSLRFYSLMCFKFLDKSTIKNHEDEFFNMISKEDNESLIIAGIPALIKLDESKSLAHFVRYLKAGTSGLRNVCYIYLSKMDNSYIENVKEQLRKENVEDALFYLEKKLRK